MGFFRVKLMDGTKLGEVLMESRDRSECIRFINETASKYYPKDEMDIVEINASVYAFNYAESSAPYLVTDYRTYRAARNDVLNTGWEELNFWWLYDEYNQNVMLYKENGVIYCSEMYEDWLKSNRIWLNYNLYRDDEPDFYPVEKEELIKLKKADIIKVAKKKMPLVHLDFATAKQSTSREEFNKEFFVYMQREDC